MCNKICAAPNIQLKMSDTKCETKNIQHKCLTLNVKHTMFSTNDQYIMYITRRVYKKTTAKKNCRN